MNIAGAIILYHPTAEVLANIEAYASSVRKLFVFDNTDKAVNTIGEKIRNLSGVSYFHDGVNKGIATRLNQACECALSEGYVYLLTMDQDSFFKHQNIEAYFTCIKNYQDNGDIAMFGVIPVRDANICYSLNCSSENVTALITSGSVINLSAFLKIGGFDEKLFIDEVDHEYCYRARQYKFTIIRFNNIILQHQLGTIKRAGYFGTLGVRERIIHSPGRLYFMIRNYLYVRKRYMNLGKDEFKMRDKDIWTTIKNNLFFSGFFGDVFINILKAYIDYKRGKFPMKKTKSG